ncbi:MIEF1 upstream open reading frame protein-like [Lytechinus variegatus]|uniref:MIEF1 upstream open reading frame protein-like n=1 Tax=Lytechinus variegatus TaxID=7654 RepID=UPI001BB2752F|nr:MIEF1 upstream open reading frame protein-like [Lytechinus variegatus]
MKKNHWLVTMMLQVAWSRQAVLGLYKRLLREGTNLRYTDQEFYKRSIQKEFRVHQAEKNQAEQQRQLDRGFYFLHSKLGGLV